MPVLRSIALLCCLSLFCHVALAQRPNVIVVMTDDQGYGELSCHGNPVIADAEPRSAAWGERAVHRLSCRSDVYADAGAVDDGD